MLTGDEIISDSYDLKEIDGVVYEADCKKISVGGETFGAHPYLPANVHLRLTTYRHWCQRLRRGG